MNKAILFIFSGLPAVGKSTLAAFVAGEFKTTYLPIDSIEQGLKALCSMNIEGEGYRLAYRIAEDNLKLMRSMELRSVSSTPRLQRGIYSTAAQAKPFD